MNSQQAKILIVDDEEIVRVSLENWLKEDGHLVASAASAKAALALLEENAWEIMLVEDGRVVFRVNDGTRDWTVTSNSRVPKDKWCHVACVSERQSGRMKV